MTTRMTIENALSEVAEVEEPFKALFRHGSLEVEMYKPEGVDHQQPHTRDEIYVVAAGSGTFVIDGARQECIAGEVIFVAAGVGHRFVDFTEDFATWVFFYGPEGGESPAAG